MSVPLLALSAVRPASPQVERGFESRQLQIWPSFVSQGGEEEEERGEESNKIR